MYYIMKVILQTSNKDCFLYANTVKTDIYIVINKKKWK